MGKTRTSKKDFVKHNLDRVGEITRSQERLDSQERKEQQESQDKEDIFSKKKKNYLLPIIVSNILKQEANKLTSLNFDTGRFKNIHESDVITNIVANYFNLELPDDLKIDLK